MLKKDKRGRFRKMTPKAAQREAKQWRDDTVKALETAAAAIVENPSAILTRIVANLSDSYELADVLVEIRNKLQRIADEAPPLVIGEAYVTREPRDERRNAAIRNLGDAIRNARRMETWRPKVDKFATVGDMQREAYDANGGMFPPPSRIAHVVGTDRRRFGIKPPTGPAEDPVPTPKRLRKDDVMLPCCDHIVRPGKRTRIVHCHNRTFSVTKRRVVEVARS
jgi:hypothetical protein